MPPLVTVGHALDVDTIALWKMDTLLADTRGATFTDSTGGSWTMAEGVVGISSGPIADHYSRRFVTDESVAGNRTAMRLSTSTSAGIRSMLIASWTWEAFIYLPRVPGPGLAFQMWAHGGLSSSETSANNDLVRINSFPSGATNYLQVFWETGSGTNISMNQSTGAGITVGAWHHVAVSKNTATKEVKIYVDGALQETMSYSTEPTDGSTGCWCWGANEASTTLGGGAVMSVSFAQVSSVVRDATWIGNNYARLFTQPTMITDGSTHTSWNFDNAPAEVDSAPTGYHLLSAGFAATDVTTPAGRLIDDGGRARWFAKCVLRTWWSTEIRAAMLADFTWEGWVLIGSPPAVTNGLFQFGNAGATELQSGNHVSAQAYPDGSIVLIAEHGAGVDDSHTTAAGLVTYGTRQHIAIRKKMFGATFQWSVFINGVLASQSATTRVNYDGGTDVETTAFQLGMSQSTTTAADPFHIGSMDDVRLSRIARTDAEILDSYNRGSGINLVPTITIISPTPGVQPGAAGGFSANWAVARVTPIVIEVDGAGLTYACVAARYPTDSGKIERVVYRRGAVRAGFTEASIALQVSTTKLRLTVLPDDGWPSFEAIKSMVFDGDALAGGAMSDVAASS